jgi:hypothetical protein
MEKEILSVWNEVRVTADGVSVTLYSESTDSGAVVEDEYWISKDEMADTPHSVESLRMESSLHQETPSRSESNFSEGQVVVDKSPPKWAEGERLVVDEVLAYPQVTAETYLYEENTTTRMGEQLGLLAQTVADVNRDYPADDRVILARYEGSDKQYAFPASRLRGVAHGEV